MTFFTCLSWGNIKFKQWSLLIINCYSPILKILRVLWNFHGGIEGDRDVSSIWNWLDVDVWAWCLFKNLGVHFFVGVEEFYVVTLELKFQIVICISPFTIFYCNLKGFVCWGCNVLYLYDLPRCLIKNYVRRASEINWNVDSIFFRIFWFWNLKYEISGSMS